MPKWLAVALAALPLAASAGGRSKIAVMDIRSVQGVSAGTATILTAIAVSDAARAGYDVISQGDISAMIGFEKQRQMLGCQEQASCLAEIGGALGVDHVLSGQVGQIGSRYHLSFILLDSRKARIVARSARFSDKDEDALAAAAEAAIAELLAAARPAGSAAASAAAAPTRTSTTAAARPVAPDLTIREPPRAPVAPIAPGPASAFRPTRNAAYWTLGAGATLLAAGTAAGLAARAKYAQLKSDWRDPAYASLYDANSGDVRRLSIVADVCFAAGAATAGVGGWLWWRSAPAIAVAPEVRDGAVALVATGRF